MPISSNNLYYHGLDSELFNLESDPGEIHNRINDPDCRTLRDSLHRQALQGWSPEIILRQRATAAQERALQAAWIHRTHPPEPDPLWFQTPPANHVDQTLQPPSANKLTIQPRQMSCRSCLTEETGGSSCQMVSSWFRGHC